MKHLDDGSLRRMIDEPEAFSGEERLHARECDQCRERGAGVRSDARFAAGMLGGDVPVHLRPLRPAPRRVRPMWAGIAGLSVAAALVVALIFSPLGGYAAGFLTVFQPKTFTTVDISQSDLQDFKLLPQADRIGTIRNNLRPRRFAVDSLAAAGAWAGFPVLHPSSVPAELGKVVSYHVQTRGEFTFTFSAAKARAYAARRHKPLPAMPPNLNGTTVRVALGPMVVATYGEHRGKRDRTEPFLFFVQTQSPKVTSTGASLATLERYLLAMPGVSPRLAAQIRALGDLSQTVPIPIRPDKQTAQHVVVDGASGLAIGDNTGLGAGVVWQKNGIVYGVGGPLSENDVLAFADGLK